MISTGVAWFDDPSLENNTEGWFCINGSNPNRFSRHSDLQSDCMFITNMDFNSLGKISISRHNLLLESFLPTKMDDMLSDLGTSIDDIKIPGAIQIASSIFGAALAMAQNYYGESVMSAFSLSKGIGEVINQEIGNDLKNDDMLIYALKDAYLRSTLCEFSKGAAWMSGKPISHIFRFNRVLHARNVLSHKAPKGNSRLIQKKESVRAILSKSRPSLVQVSVRDFNHEAAQIFAFGIRSGQNSKGRSAPLRTWVTSTELEVLDRYANVETVDHPWFIWDEGWMDHKFKLPECLNNPMIAATYSGQLLADAYLTAILSDQYENRRKYFTPTCTFLSAAERMDMFQVAAEASKLSGTTVISFGPGRVKAQTRTTFNNKSLLVWAKNRGFIFPPEFPEMDE